MAIKEIITTLINNKKQKKVGENILALTLMNGVNLLSPLLLIPYLIRVLGAEYYGVYIFAWTFIGYFIMLVNYGYDLYATKQVAIHKNDKPYLSAIFYSITASRVLLAVISSIIVVVCVWLIPEFNAHSILILYGIGVFVGQSLHPTWLFQGMEEMKFITIITLVTRLIPIVFIYIFVKGIADYYYITLFQSVGYLFGAGLAFFVAIKRYQLIFKIPALSEILLQLKSSWTLFLSTLGITLYRETNVLILGFMTGNYTLVGYYALADKFLRLFQMMITPIGQALFPHFGSTFKDNKELAFAQFHKIGRFFILFLVSLSIFVFAFAPIMTKMYLGDVFPSINTDIRVLSLVIIVSGISYLYGVVGLVNLGKEKQFTIFVFIAGIINILTSFALSRPLGDLGAALAVTLSEVVLCILVVHTFVKIKNNKPVQ